MVGLSYSVGPSCSSASKSAADRKELCTLVPKFSCIPALSLPPAGTAFSLCWRVESCPVVSLSVAEPGERRGLGCYYVAEKASGEWQLHANCHDTPIHRRKISFSDTRYDTLLVHTLILCWLFDLLALSGVDYVAWQGRLCSSIRLKLLL